VSLLSLQNSARTRPWRNLPCVLLGRRRTRRPWRAGSEGWAKRQVKPRIGAHQFPSLWRMRSGPF